MTYSRGSECYITVFAPTNQAFRNAGFPDSATIAVADQAVETAVVSYHVLGTNVFASDLINNSTAASLQGNLSIITSPSAGLKVASSTTAYSNIVVPNLFATNGVIHIIDRVILP